MSQLASSSMWPSDWDCTPSILTLNGSFYLFNSVNQSYSFNNLTGQTVINGCAVELSTGSQKLLSDALSGNTSLVQPFWETITPLVAAIVISVTLSYVLLLISFMSHSKRPWLQRGAALGAVVVLTLVTDLVWKELEQQHYSGAAYNSEHVKNVRTNNALKILRIIANTIAWLAQVQVLIRLFPRHRDKVVIKWTGLFLIILETIFGILNDFIHPSPVNPNSTNALVPAIPVLAYLFHIALGVLYAVCVLFYTVSNGRWIHAYAPRNLAIAVASIVSIVSPVAFFCLSIWNEQVEGWGDYVRLVGCIAASVILWDWIDQIEALIEHDSKSGVLGREVFEDEMINGKKANKTDDTKQKKSWISNIPRKMRLFSTEGKTIAGSTIELPIIHHPSVRPRRGTNSCGTPSQSEHSGNLAPTLFLPRNSQDYETIRSDGTADQSELNSSQFPRASQSRLGERYRIDSSLERESHPARPSNIFPSSASHRGFVPEDYWYDEKDVITNVSSMSQ